jgi:hypothetical protein
VGLAFPENLFDEPLCFINDDPSAGPTGVLNGFPFITATKVCASIEGLAHEGFWTILATRQNFYRQI